MQPFITSTEINTIETQSRALSTEDTKEKPAKSEISGTAVSHSKQEPIVVPKVLSLAFIMIANVKDSHVSL
jgi:hypothetical protein